MSIYERQHHLHQEAEKLKRLAADERLSPRAAAAAHHQAHLAKMARRLIDKHVVGQHFPEDTHHRDGAHALLAQLRRDGTDTPDHVEHMLNLAHRLAHEIEATKREMAPYQLLRVPLPERLMNRVRLLFRAPSARG